jgi:nitroreductase
MELVEVLRRRRMVRRYDPLRPVPPADLEAVLDAALRAPSAGYTQAVSYLVLTGDQVPDYWSATADPRPDDRWLSGLRTAPVLILVWTDQQAYLDRYAQPDKGWTDRDPARWSAPYWFVDAGMGVMAALLAAVDRGLGACFFGVPPDRAAAVRRLFRVPSGHASVGVISLGYTASGPRARPRRRRDRTELVHRGVWAMPVPDHVST